MGCEIYLAMTAAEFSACSPLPAHIGWMACHFSPYGKGLSNLPATLPPGSMLILNDRVNIFGHDPALIAQQLSGAAEELQAGSVLLDLQRPGEPQIPPLIRALRDALPCPMAVSEPYARVSDAGVFLAPCPLTVPLPAHLAPWAGRKIWLEAAIQSQTVTVTKGGSTFSSPYEQCEGAYPHTDQRLHCRYRMEMGDDSVRFTLHRGLEELRGLQEEANALGVEAMVGLYQELGEN